MENILNFFNSNYIIIAVVLILILMAIIGYYAEKTNFGTRPLEDGKKNKKQDIDENKRLNDYIQENMEIDPNIQKSVGESNQVQNTVQNFEQIPQPVQTIQSNHLNQNNIQQPVVNNDLQLQNSNNNYSVDSTDVTGSMTESIENFDKNQAIDSATIYNIDEEFSKVISKNNLSDDLTDDIEQMIIEPLSIDNKLNDDKKLSSINIDLPEISNLKTDDDIWKF